MKILMLIASLDTGGAETHVYELSLALKKAGHDITVASLGGTLSDKLVRLGVRHIRIDLASRSPYNMLRSYLALRSLIKCEGFDVVHAHSRVAALLGGRAARVNKRLFLTTAHAKFRLTPITKALSRWGYYTCAVSEDLASYLIDNYSVSADKIRIIKNGIDTKKFTPSSVIGEGIIFVSRLDSDSSDAAYALCRIAKDLAARYGKIKVRIVGGGEEYERLYRQAQKVNRDLGYEAVILLGKMSDISRELRRSRIFVGVSRCALEAMSCGLPVVLAGNEGAFGKVTSSNIDLAAKSNFCGRGCEPISDKKLLCDLTALLDMSDAEYRQLSEQLREYVLENNSVVSCARQTEELYKEALGSVSFEKGRVCLCGYYGYLNLGDDTLLEQAIRRARAEYNTKDISALTFAPRSAEYRFGIRCVGRYDLLSILRTIRASDTVIFGGGTLFQDRTSLRSMLYYSALAKMAQKCGARVGLWGNGLSPLRYAISRRLLKSVLSNCSYVGLRDRESLKIASSILGSDKGLFLENDLAFNIDPTECQHTYRTKELLFGTGRYAVFSVSVTGGKGAYDLIKKRAQKAKKEGIFCIVAVMYEAQDKPLCERLAKEVGGVCAPSLSARELIALLGDAEFCCSSRLHLLIFSKIADTSYEGVGNDQKIRAFCEENGGKYLRG